ncbi:MAG: MBL fold metallo-hydrolase [Patescibacteria group bacterium]
MIITYFGKQFFKIAQGDMTIALNPVGKGSKSGVSARFGADIALSTTNHPDYNGTAEVAHGEKRPFVISGPGDYEVKEIFVKGAATDAMLGGKRYVNTVYSLEVDGSTLTFLGALSNPELSKEAHEAIGSPDILFIPAGGEGLIDPKASAKLASALEPKLIIPMDYDDKSLKTFLKELGEEKAEAVEKITIKRKDLEGKEGEVLVLKRT